MKSIIVCLITALILMSCITETSNAISLTDYTFPDSKSQEAYVNGVFGALGNSTENSEVGYNLAGSASYRLYLRSLPFSYDLSLLGNFSLDKSTIEDSESEDSYNISASTTADKYLRDDSNVFGYGSIFADYRKLSYQDEADDPRIDLEVGVGYGRTINATVLKQAIRINEDFLKYDVISKSMPDKTLLELARVIDRESEFRGQYGSVEYQKYWFEEMEAIIGKSGVLKGENLGAIGIIRIQEVLDEPTAQRWHGWSVRGGVGYRISDYDGESGDPRLSARFDWTRPASLRLQLTNNTSFSTILEDDPVYTLQELFRVDYELSNRIDWYNSFEATYDILTADGAENVLQMNLKSTYIFYIENQLTFNPGLQYQYIDDGTGDASWNWSLIGSISYRLK